tara:strand:- start:20031 stop:21086 length:1056 start_codon:yes stop_codon:yes gene_type:complete
MNFQKHLVYIALLSMCISNAQTEFRSGYIILKDKDTLFGEIDYRADRLMARVCTFKKDKTVLKYTPADIEAYRFTDGKYFISKNVDGVPVFLQFLIQGKLNVYYSYDQVEKSHYYLEDDKGVFKELPFEENIVFTDEKRYLKKSDYHKGFLNIFTADAPELKSEINSISEPKHSNLISLAKNYHNSVCDTEECIIYESKRARSTVSLEVQAGVFMYATNELTENISDKNVFQTGVFAHFSLPFLGDKWYIKTGVLYSENKYSETDALVESIFRVPIHIEYIHFKGRIRPTFSYGVNIHKIMGASLNAGVNVQLTDTLFWSINGSIDYESKFMIIPKESMGTSLNSGLFYKL